MPPVDRAIIAAGENARGITTATSGWNCADKQCDPMRENEFQFIRGLFCARSRVTLGPDKPELAAARLGRRQPATNLVNVGDCGRLRRSP